MNNFTYPNLYSSLRNIVLKPSPAWQVDSGLEPGRVEEKIREEKTRCDPVDPARSGQKPSCNSLTFFFLLKRCHFDFFKKLTRTTR
jgi:hypothetical protein